VRGRAHDLLWMASLAARRGSGSETLFDLILPLSSDPRPVVRNGRRNNRPQHTYKLVCGPDDDGAPCITIMRPDED
jgi:hypothetical protein